MDLSTSPRTALHYALQQSPRPKLRSPRLWLSLMKQQLRSKHNMNWKEAFDIAKNKNLWKALIKDSRCSKNYSLSLCNVNIGVISAQSYSLIVFTIYRERNRGREVLNIMEQVSMQLDWVFYQQDLSLRLVKMLISCGNLSQNKVYLLDALKRKVSVL